MCQLDSLGMEGDRSRIERGRGGDTRERKMQGSRGRGRSQVGRV